MAKKLVAIVGRGSTGAALAHAITSAHYGARVADVARAAHQRQQQKKDKDRG